METDTGYAVGGQNSPVRVDPQWHQVRLASWRSPTEHCGTAIWSAFFGSADPRGTRFNDLGGAHHCGAATGAVLMAKRCTRFLVGPCRAAQVGPSSRMMLWARSKCSEKHADYGSCHCPRGKPANYQQRSFDGEFSHDIAIPGHHHHDRHDGHRNNSIDNSAPVKGFNWVDGREIEGGADHRGKSNRDIELLRLH